MDDGPFGPRYWRPPPGPLEPGLHTVRIEWTGTKRSAAINTNIGVDAFDLQGSLTGGG